MSTSYPPSRRLRRDGECRSPVSWFAKLKTALTRTREVFGGELETMALARRPVDEALWEDLEEILLAADFGVPTTLKIVDALRAVAKQDRYETSDRVVEPFPPDLKTSLTLPPIPPP